MARCQRLDRGRRDRGAAPLAILIWRRSSRTALGSAERCGPKTPVHRVDGWPATRPIRARKPCGGLRFGRRAQWPHSYLEREGVDFGAVAGLGCAPSARIHDVDNLMHQQRG